MKNEGPIGKNMREATLAKGKPIALEKVRLYGYRWACEG